MPALIYSHMPNPSHEAESDGTGTGTGTGERDDDRDGERDETGESITVEIPIDLAENLLPALYVGSIYLGTTYTEADEEAIDEFSVGLMKDLCKSGYEEAAEAGHRRISHFKFAMEKEVDPTMIARIDEADEQVPAQDLMEELPEEAVEMAAVDVDEQDVSEETAAALEDLVAGEDIDDGEYVTIDFGELPDHVQEELLDLGVDSEMIADDNAISVAARENADPNQDPRGYQ